MIGLRERRTTESVLRYDRGGRRNWSERTRTASTGECVSPDLPAKFFVNHGLVSNPVDIYHLLRPLLRQTVAYRYLRGSKVVSHGTGWVERIVADRPDVASFFTPLSICLSVASWEHLEFETRPDQLITYTLVQADERVVLEFLPSPGAEDDGNVQEPLPFQASPGYVQMELGALDAPDSPEAEHEGEGDGGEAGGPGSTGEASPG